MPDEALRAQEWQALYAELVTALKCLGQEDACGEGDFWVVDDDWGGYRHKVCVTRLAFLTPEVVHALQQVLNRFSRPWEVVIALDFPDAGRPAEGEGLLVTQSAIETHWDAVRLARVFGSQFRWPG